MLVYFYNSFRLNKYDFTKAKALMIDKMIKREQN